MARRADPARIARLDAVQRVRQAGAEAELAAAKDEEARANTEADARREELIANQNLWFDYLGRPAFAPEFARSIANQLVASDAAEKNANQRHRLAVQWSEHCVDGWRLADARVRATTEQLRSARRAVAARHEERRLAEFADQVTWDWMTR
ncbi:MAG: hypothetical protein ABIS14_09440 [Sphingomonas sp.]